MQRRWRPPTVYWSAASRVGCLSVDLVIWRGQRGDPCFRDQALGWPSCSSFWRLREPLEVYRVVLVFHLTARSASCMGLWRADMPALCFAVASHAGAAPGKCGRPRGGRVTVPARAAAPRGTPRRAVRVPVVCARAATRHSLVSLHRTRLARDATVTTRRFVGEVREEPKTQESYTERPAGGGGRGRGPAGLREPRDGSRPAA